MKKGLILVLILLVTGCSRISPEDNVRIQRRHYDLSIELTVNEAGEASYEIEALNKGGADLSEVTAFVNILDKDKKVLWSKKVEIDVNGTGRGATATSQHKDQVGQLDFEYFDLVLAPDDETSKFATYREFMRVAK